MNKRTVTIGSKTALLSLALSLSGAAAAYGPPGGYGYGPYPQHGGGYGYRQGYTGPYQTSVQTRQQEQPGEDTGVQIRGMQFEPATLVVDQGTTVVWSQQSAMPHVVKSGTGSFDSGILQPGQSYSLTFNEAGTYDYFCSLHPSMQGRIVVQ